MAKPETVQREIQWGSAQVEDGVLTVELAGGTSSDWNRRLEAVLNRLGRAGSRWGAIKVTKKQIKVEAVQAGGEADLRHFLESAVQQTNADLAPPAPEAEGGDGDRPSGPDAEMTEAFRAFAGEESGEDAGE